MLRGLLAIRLTTATTSQCRCYARRVRNPSNPGIGKQMTALAEAPGQPLPHPEDDPEDYSHLETDFANVELVQRSHKREEAAYRERIQHMIVRTKYFKTTQLNFLTWAEKEQIRHLHQHDADEWSPEKLADSFPADQLTITKVLRAKWLPRNDKRVRRHDEGVRRAWQALLNGGDALDGTLREHLLKFSHRGTVTATERPAVRRTIESSSYVAAPTNNTEFANIITSCAKYREPEVAAPKKEERLELPARPPDSDTFLLGKVNRSKPLMFKELTGITDVHDKGVDGSVKRRHNPLEDPRDEHESVGAVDNGADQGSWNVRKYETMAVQSTEADLKMLSMPAIQDYISIPKTLYRRGATYKLRDCYYDDDGEFLYRVPGMTGVKP